MGLDNKEIYNDDFWINGTLSKNILLITFYQ
jgi:hypothetical protein